MRRPRRPRDALVHERPAEVVAPGGEQVTGHLRPHLDPRRLDVGQTGGAEREAGGGVGQHALPRRSARVFVVFVFSEASLNCSSLLTDDRLGYAYAYTNIVYVHREREGERGRETKTERNREREKKRGGGNT